jgi:hypothetical protein
MRRAGKQGVLLLACAWLLVTGVLGSSRSAPLTIWASSPLLDSRAHFEVSGSLGVSAGADPTHDPARSTPKPWPTLCPTQSLPASEILRDLVSLAAGAAPAAGSPLSGLLAQGAPEGARPKALVVFVSAQRDGSSADSQLRALTSAAGSWVQLPNAVHQVGCSHPFPALCSGIWTAKSSGGLCGWLGFRWLGPSNVSCGNQQPRSLQAPCALSESRSVLRATKNCSPLRQPTGPSSTNFSQGMAPAICSARPAWQNPSTT